MQFKVSHIYREGNNCADKMAFLELVIDVILGGIISLLLLIETSFIKSLVYHFTA
jgi:hypothetical protein